MKLSMILARSLDDVIGIGDRLPWHCAAELAHFKLITMREGNGVAMGRKTWNSLPKRPLADRYNIVISKHPELILDNGSSTTTVASVTSIDEAIEHGKSVGLKELIFIGGAEIYKQVIDRVDEVYLTEMNLCVSDIVEHPETVTFEYFFNYSEYDVEQDWIKLVKYKVYDEQHLELFEFHHFKRKVI